MEIVQHVDELWLDQIEFVICETIEKTDSHMAQLFEMGTQHASYACITIIS